MFTTVLYVSALHIFSLIHFMLHLLKKQLDKSLFFVVFFFVPMCTECWNNAKTLLDSDYPTLPALELH